MHKYADDRPTYLVVPATNVQSSAAEIENVELWADVNLKLNRTKSAEIVFVPHCHGRADVTNF
jgi:hypothetical protein